MHQPKRGRLRQRFSRYLLKTKQISGRLGENRLGARTASVAVEYRSIESANKDTRRTQLVVDVVGRPRQNKAGSL